MFVYLRQDTTLGEIREHDGQWKEKKKFFLFLFLQIKSSPSCEKIASASVSHWHLQLFAHMTLATTTATTTTATTTKATTANRRAQVIYASGRYIISIVIVIIIIFFSPLGVGVLLMVSN